jgi:hypothetical protein
MQARSGRETEEEGVRLKRRDEDEEEKKRRSEEERRQLWLRTNGRRSTVRYGTVTTETGKPNHGSADSMIHALPFPTSMDTDSLPIPEIYIICESHAAAMQMLDKTKTNRTASLAWLHPETARQPKTRKKHLCARGFETPESARTSSVFSMVAPSFISISPSASPKPAGRSLFVRSTMRQTAPETLAPGGVT